MLIHFLSLVIFALTIYFSNQIITEEIPFIFEKMLKDDEPSHGNLREWLKKLIFDLPNDIIKNKTAGVLQDITLYEMSLERLVTTDPSVTELKIGVNISIERAAAKIKGIFNNPITSEPKPFVANISNLNVEFPFYLIRDEKTGLVSNVSTDGFSIDLDKAKIEFDIDIPLKDVIIPLLKLVLTFIKESVIEKNIIIAMNEKFRDLFQKANKIILEGIQPKPLEIVTKEADRADLRLSPVIAAVGYLLSNLTGADGPLSLNNLVNMFTYDTGIVKLHDFYNKSIHFTFNLTNKNNHSLGNFDIGLEDLNISGLNTWRNFSALEPCDKILLNTYTNLDDLTINLTFSLKITLDKTSGLVKEESILYELANFRTNMVNNSLNGFTQLPINNPKAKGYSDKECLDFNCITDLADSNGTGIQALSLNETFTYIKLEVAEEGGLEEDVDDTIDKLIDVFIKGYVTKISLLINALLNITVIDLVNEQINKYLYSTSCPGIPNPNDLELDVAITSFAFISALALFFILIVYPYIFGKACKKNTETIKVNLLDNNEESPNRITNASEIKDVKNYDMQSTYCFSSVSIKWLKEFGRTDPYGASLFLHPHIPIFWRIFIPLAIISTISLFISSNSATGASVFVVFDVGRRVQIPSLFDFGLINSVRDMWKAGVYPLSIIVAVFSGIWPYLKLVLMFISFILPASILSQRKREVILMILDATGKWSILDSYVMILILIAFHFNIDIPVVPPSHAEKGANVNVFVYAAYGFFTLILGTIISLILSHIITHLHRGLDEHPDQNKGEKAESYKALIAFAENKTLGKAFFRTLITVLIFATLGLVTVGSFTTSFSFYFHGLAGYALDLFKISPHREYSVFELGINVPESYENPNDAVIRFTQVIYFITVFIMPVTMLLNVILLWFIPMPRKAQKFFYSIAEILNAWSCLDVFVVAIIAAIMEIGQFTEFIVGDKCDAINPYISKYFYKVLDGHNTCFEVKAYLQSGCWFMFAAAIIFFISSNIVMKVCRNALDERLPDNVKEYLKNKKDGERISKIVSFSNTNDIISEASNNDITSISNINNSRKSLAKVNIKDEN